MDQNWLDKNMYTKNKKIKKKPRIGFKILLDTGKDEKWMDHNKYQSKRPNKLNDLF